MPALFQTAGLFVLTAVAEIFGCYTVYLWLRAAGSRWWLLPGAVSLGAFAWLLTLHPTGSAGRTYAAYGGVYVVTALVWQQLIESKAISGKDLTMLEWACSDDPPSM